MKKLILYLICLALCCGLMSLEFTLKDAADYILLGVAAFLLSAVMYFLLLAGWAIYRAIRHWGGPEILEAGLLYYGGLTSVLVPWEEIDALEIKMVSVYRSGGQAPVFFVHWVKRKKGLRIWRKNMEATVAAIQERVRSRSVRYTQRDIDWVARWCEVDPLTKLKKQQAERKPDEPVFTPEIKERLDALRAAGMSDKQLLDEYIKMTNQEK